MCNFPIFSSINYCNHVYFCPTACICDKIGVWGTGGNWGEFGAQGVRGSGSPATAAILAQPEKRTRGVILHNFHPSPIREDCTISNFHAITLHIFSPSGNITNYFPCTSRYWTGKAQSQPSYSPPSSYSQSSHYCAARARPTSFLIDAGHAIFRPISTLNLQILWRLYLKSATN